MSINVEGFDTIYCEIRVEAEDMTTALKQAIRLTAEKFVGGKIEIRSVEMGNHCCDRCQRPF